jgi:hypothetical protein
MGHPSGRVSRTTDDITLVRDIAVTIASALNAREPASTPSVLPTASAPNPAWELSS